MTQHDLLVRVLEGAGGSPLEAVLPPSYKGKLADILFASDNIIVEVKSLTTDRAGAPATAKAVSEMLAKNHELGAPIIFGTVPINVRDLPPPVATNAMRILGRRVQTEARAANRQIKATKAALDRPDALGVIALVTPPFKLDRQSIAWAMGDAMRADQCSGIDLLFLVETPLAAPPPAKREGNSFLSLHSRPDHSRSERALPRELVEAINLSWGRVTGQAGRSLDADYFRAFGATS
ncbi:MAG: hypothetical protein Q7T19_05280 [Caulobacter sp.]|nr:hypothetical protein [Caulobacter sp.]